MQPGLHMSVSPDDGNGGRMSYLRFEDQADGVHVFFDDATDAGPVGTVADFSDSDIATLNRTSAHTVTFGIGFRTDAADLVNIYVDGSLKHSGTTWENYYRYDPEQDGNSHAIPNTSKLLFREGGAANSGNAGGGFLVDGVSLTSSTCTPTTFSRDGHFLTAAQIGGPVSGTLEATGCDIGVYYEPGSGPTEAVSSGDISGAKYFGVLVNGATVDVTNSSVHSIGDVPLNGSQHGNAIVYLNGAHGTISGNHVFNYQKNGITVSGVDDNGTVRPNPTTSASVLNNVVTGEGHVSYIAQNGIQISFGASGLVRGNTVSLNWYTPAGTEACGLLLYQANGVKQQMNNLFDNEVNFCNFGRGGGHVSPQA
ncbi:MAG TPA: hypothetical protein VHT50_04870 [Mycobacterium sp.]|nr:hypothetical protein [Mycobacterium sp.]